jgi:DNA-binding NtrC family response regulator
MGVAADSDVATASGGGSEPIGEGEFGERLLVLRWVFPDAAETILSSASVVVGRTRPSHTRLDSAQVSRQHASVSLVEPCVGRLVDLDSKNGVFVNGAPVTESLLLPGHVVRLGDFVGVVELVAAEPIVGFRHWGEGIFGGQALQRVVTQSRTLAATGSPLVIEGASGTGKERFARAIHAWSRRAGPFFPVNCATYSESLAVGELFGYRKGAFTGAERAHEGHVRAAHGGTLLLDEVLDLPLDVQAKLLRCIEERSVLALGDTRPTAVDVRFIAASQTSLAEAVRAGRFRADLRARLEGMVLALPPLEARRADIAPLLMELLARETVGRPPPPLDARLVERACLHDWPLNVRELETVARRLIAFHGSEPMLKERHLVEALGLLPVGGAAGGATNRATTTSRAPAVTAPDRRGRPPPAGDAAPPGTADTRRARIAEALARCGGNQTRAARLLGVPRRTLLRQIERLQIPRPRRAGSGGP